MIDVVGERNSHEPPRGMPFKKLRNGLCKFPLGGSYDPPERFCGEPTLIGGRRTAPRASASPIRARHG